MFFTPRANRGTVKVLPAEEKSRLKQARFLLEGSFLAGKWRTTVGDGVVGSSCNLQANSGDIELDVKIAEWLHLDKVTDSFPFLT